MVLSCTVAFLLDLIFGDPQVWFHPIRILGKIIEWGEKFVRGVVKSESLGGFFWAIGLPIFVFVSTDIFLNAVSKISHLCLLLFEVAFLYVCFSVKDLAVESRWVKVALMDGDLSLARKKLSWIVGRDTEHLEEREIIRATVETIGESTVDGIVAPLFYAFLGGAPLAVCYKAVNTLDSMIGHKNARYLRFGKSAAFIDRAANWIPARLSGFCIPLAAFLLGKFYRKSWESAWKGAKSKVPNAGIPEGAFAGALGVRLGGVNYYEGAASKTDYLGEEKYPLTVDKIEEAIQIHYAASILFFLMGLGTLFIFKR